MKPRRLLDRPPPALNLTPAGLLALHRADRDGRPAAGMAAVRLRRTGQIDRDNRPTRAGRDSLALAARAALAGEG